MEVRPSPEIQHVSEANGHSLGSGERPINVTSEKESFSKFNSSLETKVYVTSQCNHEGDPTPPLNVDNFQLMPGTASHCSQFGQKESLQTDCTQYGHGDKHPNGIHREQVDSQLDMPQAVNEAPNGTHDKEGSIPNVHMDHQNIVEEFAIGLHDKEHIGAKPEKEKVQLSLLENPVSVMVPDSVTINGNKQLESVQTEKVDASSGTDELYCTLDSFNSMDIGSQLVSPNVGHDTLQDISDKKNNAMGSLSNFEEKSVKQSAENGSSSSSLDGGDVHNIKHDDTVAFWVKWRGKWQAGIQCSRIDCPLSTLKAKPTHERKNYVPVFFPNSRTHCWADASLLRPIHEQPEPLAYGTHYLGKEFVKDLNAPRRYIMQKLAVAMLDVIDKLHIESVIEDARSATAWKEFAMEASQCEKYSDLGRMLLKLQSTILSSYMSSYWLEHSYDCWACQCQNARDAQSVEILMKELMDSVLWDKISDLWDAPVQPDLGSEWKTCKQEVMKLFSTSHALPTSFEGDFQKCGDAIESTPVCRKRQKLEVRRAEVHDSPTNPCNVHKSLSQVAGENYSCDTDCSGLMKGTLEAGNIGEENSSKESLTVEPVSNEVEHSVALVTEIRRADPQVVEDATTPHGLGTSNDLQMVIRKASSGKGDRQCSAFVESKGRQCGRWANVGYMYCAKHLNLLSPDNAVKPKQLPISSSSLLLCSGTTTSGKRCKHRSRDGSGYCLKHKLYDGNEITHSMRPSGSTSNKVRRKRRRKRNSLRNIVLETVSGRELIMLGIDQNALHENSGAGLGGGNLYQNINAVDNSEHPTSSSTAVKGYRPDIRRCNGWCRKNDDQCLRKAKHNTTYCEKHTPNWLNCEDQFISLDIFNDLMNNARSSKQIAHLYRASELLYEFLNGTLSMGIYKGIEQDISKETFMERILSQVSGNSSMVENLLKLVSSEHEKLGHMWGFSGKKEIKRVKHVASAVDQPVVSVAYEDFQNEPMKQCKFCTDAFSDDQLLGLHWIKSHKKEAQWLFRGYACGVCKVSFTNKTVLIAHIDEKHGRQSIDHGILFLCMACNNHFNSFEQLWLHVIAAHAADLRTPDVQHKGSVTASAENNSEGFLKLESTQMLQSDKLNKTSEKYSDEEEYEARRFVCRFCGLKFPLLPDLGRHHQVAHMGPNSIVIFPQKKAEDLAISEHLERQQPDFDRFGTGRQILNYEIDEELMTSHCMDATKTLFSAIQRTKPRPSNSDILAIAEATCCRYNLQATLEAKYGLLPERFPIKVVKLCSELNFPIQWHQDGYICPKGCRPLGDHSFSLVPLPDTVSQLLPLPSDSQVTSSDANDGTLEMDESHFVFRIGSKYIKPNPPLKSVVICEDLSFGKEIIPVPCVVDDYLMNSHYKDTDTLPNGDDACPSFPWKDFTYVISRLLEPSLRLDTKSSQMGCTCPHATCHPDTCDHVRLFNNDYENAVDIEGKSMHGRFPYDESGQIVLREGCLVYECNSRCSCGHSCQNRVLQKGVQVKLEVYKTTNKRWAVRAGEAIPQGTFVCEYIGEILDQQNAVNKGKRYDSEGCTYVLEIHAHFEENGLNRDTLPYVIDAAYFGNVARFINHSCSPNLVKYQVVVETTDCQLPHVGFYTSRDIVAGEELAYDYRYKLLPSKGCPCFCGAANCRGSLC